MKSITNSKTMIFNALTVIVVLATFFGYEANQELAQQTQAIILALSPLVNLLLRMITKEPVSL